MQLLAEMSDVEEYGEDALAMVRLSRVVGKLRGAGVEATLQNAAGKLRQGAAEPSLSMQRKAIDELTKAMFRVLPGSELRALVETRDALTAIRDRQRNLRDAVSRRDRETMQRRAEEGSQEQVALQRRVDRILPPPILDENLQLAEDVLRATGLETAMSDIVPIQPFLDEAEAHMVEAAGHIREANAEAAGDAQLAAEASLDEAVESLQLRIDAAMHLDGVFRKLQAAIARLEQIDDLIDQQTELKEEAEYAAVEEAASRHFALPQDNLGVEVDSFRTRITEENRDLDAPSDFVPLVARELAAARREMIKAVAPLKDDRPGDAVAAQERALERLEKAREIASREVDLLDRLWRLLQAVKDLETFQQYLGDMEVEQRRLRGKTEQADDAGADSMASLVSNQERLAAAAKQVRGILDPGQVNLSRLGGMLDGVTGEMTAAGTRLAEGRPHAAVPRQIEAEKRLREASAEIQRLADELDYLAEWMEFLKKLSADALDLLQRQIMLRGETQEAKLAAFGELAGEQDVLRSEAESFSKLLPIGAADYAKAAGFMQKAVAAIEGEDRIEALKQMALAEDALSRAYEQLMMAMEALEQVPMLSLMDEPPEELLILTRLMLLVSRQTTLRQKTRAVAGDAGVVRFKPAQQKLLDEARDIGIVAKTELPELANAEDRMALLTNAEGEMAGAVEALNAPGRAEAVRHQQRAEKYLRRLVLELALEAFELPEQLEKKRTMSVISLLPPTITMEGEKTFAKEAVEGEMIGGDRTEWRVLGQRDRSALNQNFARELPLEYREMLRVYFERLGE
ncbi:MAG: hypothetical protein KGY81_03310 [Phycisphaerae bacterium]|nr:hypothetical protein [Phycisphaerae bacterium]